MAAATGLFFGELAVSAFSFLVFTGMLSFLLGTCQRVDLSRNAKGRVQLSRTWWICFVFKDTEPIELAEYEGVMNRLAKSARTFAMGQSSTNYFDYGMSPLLDGKGRKQLPASGRVGARSPSARA